MSPFPQPAGNCIDEAIARAPRWLGHAIDSACLTLQHEAGDGRGRRMDTAAAAAELADQRASWCAAIGGALAKAIAADGDADAPAPHADPSASSLTLVDDSQVLQTVESARLAMELDELVEDALADFDKYLSAALGLEAVHPEANPLRPAVIGRAVRTVMNDAAAQPGWTAMWLHHLARPLAAQMQSLYASCTQTLLRAGVQPAAYRISGLAPLGEGEPRVASAPVPLQAADPPAPDVVPLRAPAAQARAVRPTASGWAELASQPVDPHVLREFVAGAASAAMPLAPAYYRHVDQQLAELEALADEPPPDPELALSDKRMAAVDRPMRELGTDSPLSRETWGAFGAARQRSLVRTRLRKQALDVGQVVGLDLVRQLLDHVARDPRLLAPVREAMVALEPSLARLALHAPRFFVAPGNAARMLLEAVAQRSFRYNDEFSTEFRDFFDGVTRCFNSLNGLDSLRDAAPFEQANAQLAREWQQQDAQEERNRREVLEAVAFAEERQAQANRFAWELSLRTDLPGTPAVVQDFLFGPWSLVVAHAHLRSGGPGLDPGGFIGVITDLLWSVKRETTLREPARAFQVIPRVLAVLRAGLDLLGHPPAETQDFFHALERLHRPVLKLRAKHRKVSLHAELAAAPLDDDLKPAPAQQPTPREDLWMHEREQQACGFEDTMSSGFAATEADAQAADGAAQRPAAVLPARTLAGTQVTPAHAEALVATFERGAWVDLFCRQRWRRAQLTWASANGALFMFVSHGGRPHSMTRRSLQRLVMNRLLRPVASHEVVQHALDALVAPRAEALAA